MSLPFSARTDELIDLLPAAVYICEAPSGAIVRYNRRAAELWGREPTCGNGGERFCGAFRLFHSDGTLVARTGTPMAHVLRDGQAVRNREFVIERPDGSRVTVLVDAVPIRDDQGAVVGAVSVFQDIAGREQVEAERAGLVGRLVAEQARLEAVLQQMPAGVILAEAPSGRLLLANRQVERILGHPFRPCEAIGEYTRYEILHPDGQAFEPEELPMARAIRLGEVTSGEEVTCRRGDGTLASLLVNAGPIRDPQGRIIAGVVAFHDLTERKQVEETLRVRARQQAAVAELGQRALTGLDPAALLDEAVGVVARTLDVENVEVLELLQDRSALLLRAGVGWKAEQVGHATVGVGRASQAGYTLLTQEPIIVEDWEREARFTRPPADHEMVSGMTVIIGGREQPFGVLGAHAVRLRAFTEDDVHFLQAIANVLATAIERKQAEEELAALRDELAAQLADMTRLHGLSRRLVTSLELSPVLNEVLAAVTALQGTDMGVVTLYDRERHDLCPVASTGFDAEYVARIGRLPIGAGSCGLAAAERRGVVVEDVETDPIFAPYREAARIAGYRAVHSTPLLTRGEVLGTIATYFREPHRPSDRQMRLVELYAHQAAEFIEHAQLYREAREAVRARDVFLARASHELRTPLTSILAGIRLLQHAGPLTGAARELIAVVSRNAKAMRALLNDLLDASSLAAGEAPLAIEQVSLADVVLASKEVVEAQAHEKGVSLRSVVPDGLGLQVDPLKLIQVLTNLLANAVRHTPPGGEVAVEAEVDDGHVVIRVRDTGEGIAAEQLKGIFEPFFLAGKPGARRPRGTGLGLAICRQIVTLHGGEIRAESAGLGLGSTFTVRLPRTIGTNRAA